MEHDTAAQMAYAKAAQRSVTDSPEPSFTDRLGASFQNLDSTLRETINDLQMLTDRLFGPQPAPGVSGASAPNHPVPSRTEALLSMGVEANQRAHEIAALVRGLNGRL